jgi:hypothetical protein
VVCTAAVASELRGASALIISEDLFQLKNLLFFPPYYRCTCDSYYGIQDLHLKVMESTKFPPPPQV